MAPGCLPREVSPPRVQGLSHMTLVVSNLERMAELLCDGLGGKEIYDSLDETYSLSREKFFLLGGVWIVAMEGDPRVGRTYDHVAFKIDEAELPSFRENLVRLGVDFVPPRPRVDGEGESLYFYDFDGHLLELHTGTLEERLERYHR
jgi:catechol 2,3-dioxygenase-like lactoylglutathione lyase family enzyme